jgi:hypothetical protein
MEKVVVTKVDQTAAPVVAAVRKPKTMKTFPKGVLKRTVKRVRDPAKAPPLKKGMKRHTIRVLTEHGLKARHKTIKKRISKMKDSEVREKVQKAGLLKSAATPAPVMREMLEGAITAGFISLD